MKNSTILKKVGLSETQVRLYLAILKHGSGTVASIAQASGLYRPTVYKTIPSLMDRNLISRVRMGKRSFYVAEKPTALHYLLDDMKSNIADVIPDLLSIYNRSKRSPVIHFFEGKEGIRHVYTDLIETVKKGDIIYRYESPKNYKKNKKYYPRLYMVIAGKQNRSDIEKFVITNKNTHDIRSNQLERYSKYVPPSEDPFEYNITQIIYGDKVAFIDYESETASIIESPNFSQFQKKIFKLLFAALK